MKKPMIGVNFEVDDNVKALIAQKEALEECIEHLKQSDKEFITGLNILIDNNVISEEQYTQLYENNIDHSYVPSALDLLDCINADIQVACDQCVFNHMSKIVDKHRAGSIDNLDLNKYSWGPDGPCTD